MVDPLLCLDKINNEKKKYGVRMRTRQPSRAFIADTNHNHITYINNRQSDTFSRRILINIRYSSTNYKEKLYSLLNCNIVIF
jgi:hypothetical protein